MTRVRRPGRAGRLAPAGLALVAVSLAVSACTPTDRTPAPGPSPVPATTTGAPATPADSCQVRVDRMTPAERAGQLVMVGHQNGEDPAATRTLVERHDLGSVILMGNSTASVEQVRQMTDGLRPDGEAGRNGVLIAVDQEGGQVRRLSGPGFTAMPSARDQGRMASADLGAAARTWGEELHRAGVDIDLAPVADVVPPDLVDVNEPVAKWGRGFGSDPDAVSTSVTAFVTGLHEGGTGTAVKHFPGLGQVVGNTDFTSGVTDDRTTRDDPLLQPFAAGIAAGTDMVMISSANYPRIDPERAAIWSPTVITGMLREDLGWQGVVVSDDLGVAAQVQSVAPGERAVRFIDAGGDIAITVDPALAGDMVDGIVERAGQDQAFDAKVRAGAGRVIDLKASRGLAGCSPSQR